MKTPSRLILLASILILANQVYAQIGPDYTLQGQSVLTNITSMPLAFTKNDGQWDERALFRTSAGGATFWFCKDEVVYVFARNTGKPLEGYDQINPGHNAKFDSPRYEKEFLVINAKFIGANPNVEIICEDQCRHTCNYYKGNDHSKWRSGVPSYSSITYRDIYPGIDLKYHGDGQKMKYDFIVHPGADISRIRIRYEGADGLEVAPNGDLTASTSFGPITDEKPFVYQQSDTGEKEIAGKYVIHEPGVFGFEVDSYNPSRILVIDPYILFSTYLGGTNEDEVRGVDMVLGNVYATGFTYSSDFPPGGSYSGDIFITALSSSDGSLIYSTILGGSSMDEGYDIAVNYEYFNQWAFVTGMTDSYDFPISDDAVDNVLSYPEAFVVIIMPDGSLYYSTFLGGSLHDYGYGIDFYRNGIYVDICVTGYTYSSDFPLVNPIDNDNSTHNADAFVTILTIGDYVHEIAFSTYLGGNLDDFGYDIDVTSDASYVYITGRTESYNFPLENPLFGSYGGWDGDAFVTKIDVEDYSLVYSTFLGGSRLDEGFGIDALSDWACVTGRTGSYDFPLENALGENLGVNSAFVTRFSPEGDYLVFSTLLGADYSTSGYDIAQDAYANVYITGETQARDFPLVDPFDGELGYNDDAFLTMISPNGNYYLFSTYLGGDFFEAGRAIAIDYLFGDICVAGWTLSSDFPTENPYDGSYDGYMHDGFITVFGVGDAPGTGTIAGTVSEIGGSPIVAGAKVETSVGAYNRFDLTGETGYYEIHNLEAGYYEVEVSIDGFYSQTVTGIEVFADQTTVLDFELERWPAESYWQYTPGASSGWLTVWGTVNGHRGGTLYYNRVLQGHTYSGLIPEWANDWEMEFRWDAECNNVDEFKFAASSYNTACTGWELFPLSEWMADNLSGPLELPSIGDSTGVIQRVYTYVNLPDWIADPRPTQGVYNIVNGQCPDLPGFLIGTTPFVYDSLAGPSENPFSTTPLTGTLVLDGSVSASYQGGGGSQYLPGDVNMYNGAWPPQAIGGDVTYLVNYFRSIETSIACLLNGFWCSADANGDCNIIGSDVTRLVNYFRQQADLQYCPDYEPAWPTPDDLPVEAPTGWPNCE